MSVCLVLRVLICYQRVAYPETVRRPRTPVQPLETVEDWRRWSVGLESSLESLTRQLAEEVDLDALVQELSEALRDWEPPSITF